MIKWMRKAAGLLILSAACLSLGSCSPDARQLDHRSMILGFSIDRTDDGDYSVTIQLPKFSLGEEDKYTEFEMFTAKGERLWDAFTELESMTPTVLFFGHVKVVVISEQVAREGLRPIIDMLDRESTIANRIQLLITQDQSAEEFISKESPLVNLPFLYLERFFTAEQKLSRTQNVKLYEFRRDIKSVSKSGLLPMAFVRDQTIYIQDMAVMDGYRMAGKLEGSEAGIGFLLRDRSLANMNESATITSGSGESIKVSLGRMQMKSRMTFTRSEPVRIRMEITGKGQLMEVTGGNTKSELMKEVEEQISKKLEGETMELLTRLQELNLEPLLIGQRIQAQDDSFFKSLDWKNRGWREAQLEVKANFQIDNTGQRGIYHKKLIGE